MQFLLTSISIAVLSVALPALLIADVGDSPRSDAWIITLLVMVWAGIRLSLVSTSGIPRLFDFFFWLFTYIFMGLAPTAQIRSGLTSTTTPGVDPGLDVPTAGVVVLGIVCYELARLSWMVRESRHGAEARQAVRPVSEPRAIILFAVAVLLSAYVVSRLGFTALLGSREAASAAREAAWPDPALRGVIYAGGVYPLLVAIGALVQVHRVALSRAARRRALTGALVGAGILLLIVNPVTSARYAFGTAAFALVVYAGVLASKRSARITMMGTIFGFLFVFPVADAFRRTEVSASRTGFFEEYLSNPDYDAFWQVANALSYVIDGLVVPFFQILGSLLFWVPRAFWAGKPDDTGSILAEYRGYSFDNLSAPAWAEALVNGGVIAVVIVFLVIGVCWRVMDSKVVDAMPRGGVWAIVGAILPVYTTILMRGSLLQATGAVILTVCCIWFVRGDRPPGATTDSELARLRATLPANHPDPAVRKPAGHA